MEVSVSPLRTFANGKGYGFNAVIISDSLWVQINGFRIFTSGFTAPGIMYGRGRYYPAALVPKEVALMIVKAVLEANPIVESYLNPGLSLDDCVQGIVGDNNTILKFSVPITLEAPSAQV